MGSGKSSVGKKLAKKLQLDFVDLDSLIEQQEQQTITAIFEKRGEAYFREKETAVLKTMEPTKRAVIALGGGTPCFGNNMEYIQQTGTSFYLKVPIEKLIGRLRLKKDKRPLLAKLSKEEIALFVTDKLKEREPYYAQADFIIEQEGKSVKQLLNALQE